MELIGAARTRYAEALTACSLLGFLVDGPGVPLFAAKGRVGALQPGVTGDVGRRGVDRDEGDLALGTEDDFVWQAIIETVHLQAPLLHGVV